MLIATVATKPLSMNPYASRARKSPAAATPRLSPDVKGMTANAAIGVGVNSTAKFAGKDPFN
jgi:uncharacterized protein YbjQ (UPF0145 family)